MLKWIGTGLLIAFCHGAFAQGVQAKRTTISGLLKTVDLKTANGNSFPVTRATQTRGGVGAQEAPIRFLIQSGLHGDEALPIEFNLWLSRRFVQGVSLLNTLPTNSFSIDFASQANPDGIREKSRANGNGVNLNRNFGLFWGVSRENPGRHPFSENETKAIAYLLATQKYLASVDLHGYVPWIVAPSPPRFAQGRVPKKKTDTMSILYSPWLNAIRNAMGALGQKYELRTPVELGDGGAFEDWAFWHSETLSLCLEMSTANRREPGTAGPSDRFIAYEAFIFRVFSDAIRIRSREQPAVGEEPKWSRRPTQVIGH